MKQVNFTTNIHSMNKNADFPLTSPRIINRKFREAIEIEKQLNNLNKDDGWKISQNWIPTLANMNNSKY